MKKLWTVYILLSGLAITACSKAKEQPENTLNHTEVKGQLLDASTLEPIANGTIYLTKREGGNLWNPGHDIPFKEITTDQNGYYEYSFVHNWDSIYSVFATAENYFTNHNSGAGVTYPTGRTTGQIALSSGKINNGNILLAPRCWLKLRIRNTSQKHNRISINGIDPSGNNALSFSGYEVDSYTIVLKYGNYENELPIFLYKDNKLIRQYVEAVHCSAFDTTYYEITY